MEEVSATIFQGDHVLSRVELQPLLSGKLPASQGASSLESMDSVASGGCNNKVVQGGSSIMVSLENKDLWKQFYGIPNEMIVTKVGRRMFPLVQVNVSGLNPILHYAVLLEFQLTNHHRWRFLNGEWTAAGSFNSTEPPRPSSIYVHTSSPLTGQEWMRQKIIFSRVKLSNKEDGLGKVKLVSLYRYQPCIHIVQLDQPGQPKVSRSPATSSPVVASQSFKETQFIAVTAYQNDKITQMKIKHNPFAKAFLGSQDSSTHMRSSDDGQTSTLSCVPRSKDYLQFQTLSLPSPIIPASNIPHHKSSTTTSHCMAALTLLPTFTVSPSPPYTLAGHTTTENWLPPPICTNFPTWTSDSKTNTSQMPQEIPAYSLDGLINTRSRPPIFHGGQDISGFPGESLSGYQQPHQMVAEECGIQQLLPVIRTLPSDCNTLPVEEPSFRSSRGTSDLIYHEPNRPGTSLFQTTTLSNT